jgi:hypothetical protein
MVIDPFTDHPVVVTGSHNAEAYAGHIMAAYGHHRFALHNKRSGIKPLCRMDGQQNGTG